LSHAGASPDITRNRAAIRNDNGYRSQVRVAAGCDIAVVEKCQQAALMLAALNGQYLARGDMAGLTQAQSALADVLLEYAKAALNKYLSQGMHQYNN
jgi:hypothetical protein